MPRNQATGSEALGLTEETGLGMDGVEVVAQSTSSAASKLGQAVYDFTKVPEPLIPDGTVCQLEIKQARPAITTWGAPQVSILLQVDGGDYDGMKFFENFDFSPPNPPFRGRMWLIHAYCAAVNYELPTSIVADEMMSFLKQFAEDALGESFQATVGIYQSKTVSLKTGEIPPPKNTIKAIAKPGARSIDDLLLG